MFPMSKRRLLDFDLFEGEAEKHARMRIHAHGTGIRNFQALFFSMNQLCKNTEP